MSKHSHKTITQLRNELHWWANSRKARKQHSDEERAEEVASLEAEIARRPRGPGRPVGYRVSDETKSRISASRREGKGLKAAIKRGDGSHNALLPPPPGTNPETSEGARREAWERDYRRCRGCHAWSHDNFFDKKKGRWVVRYRRTDKVVIHHLGGDFEPDDVNGLITLCGFCCSNVRMGGLSTIGVASVMDVKRYEDPVQEEETVDPRELVAGVGEEYDR